LSDKPQIRKVDSSETSIRIGLLSAIIIGWFVSLSLSTSTYIATHGNVYGGESLLDWASVFITDYLVFIVMIISYLLAEWNIERQFDFLKLPPQYSNVDNMVFDAFRSLGLKDLPEVRFLDIEEPYSFTYGRRSKNAKLVLSKGLIETLDGEELRSVVLHELSHIKNKDLVFMTWGVSFLQALKYWLAIQLFLVPVVIIESYFQGRLWSYAGFYLSITIPIIVAMITIFTILPLLVINSVSRVREFLADTCACEFVEEKYLKSSLAKISKALVLSKIKLSLFPSHLSIMSFSSSSIPTRILQHTVATHPSTKERIEAVEKKKYLVSWENACKVDRRAGYVGIIAFAIAIVGFEILDMTRTFTGEVRTSDFFVSTAIIPIFFIFWVNGHIFNSMLEGVPFGVGAKLFGLLKILAKDLVSTIALIGLIACVLVVIIAQNPLTLFWLSFGIFLVFAGITFLYILITGGDIIFRALWSRIRRK
jgi:Zn-dependent protease with chaperone function